MYKESELKTFKEIILREVRGGKSLNRIFAEDGGIELCCMELVYEWLNPDYNNFDQVFVKNYTQARGIRADMIFEQTLNIADDSSEDFLGISKSGQPIMNKEFAARSKIRIDARQWVLARMDSKRFGNKVETTIQGGDKPIEYVDYTRLSKAALEEIAKQSNADRPE